MQKKWNSYNVGDEFEEEQGNIPQQKSQPKPVEYKITYTMYGDNKIVAKSGTILLDNNGIPTTLEVTNTEPARSGRIPTTDNCIVGECSMKNHMEGTKFLTKQESTICVACQRLVCRDRSCSCFVGYGQYRMIVCRECYPSIRSTVFGWTVFATIVNTIISLVDAVTAGGFSARVGYYQPNLFEKVKQAVIKKNRT